MIIGYESEPIDDLHLEVVYEQWLDTYTNRVATKEDFNLLLREWENSRDPVIMMKLTGMRDGIFREPWRCDVNNAKDDLVIFFRNKLQTSTNPTIIVQWWGETPPALDLKNPILPCIACIRGVMPKLRLVIIDSSEKFHDWERWSSRLNFELIRSPVNGDLQARFRRRPSLIEQASRGSRFCIFFDSDVFWFRMPSFQGIDGIHGRSLNNGVIIWDNHHKSAQEFWLKWMETIHRAEEEQDFKTSMLQSYYCDTFNDESAYIYTIKSNPGLLLPLSKYLNYYDNVYINKKWLVRKGYNIHLCKIANGINRGLIPLLLRETYAAMEMSIGEVGLKELYGQTRQWSQRGTLDLFSLCTARRIVNRDYVPKHY